MAEIYLQMNGTRRTAIGMLRFGVIYKLDDADMRMVKVINALTAKPESGEPAATRLTKKKATSAKQAIESLVPEKEPDGDPDEAGGNDPLAGGDSNANGSAAGENSSEGGSKD